MENKEFNLSEERKKLFDPVFLPLNGLDKHTMSEVKGFVEMQDEEFIKRLKDILEEDVKTWNAGLFSRIDKLTGDKG